MLGVIIKVVMVVVLVIIATAAVITMSDIDKKRLIQKGVPQLLFAALIGILIMIILGTIKVAFG